MVALSEEERAIRFVSKYDMHEGVILGEGAYGKVLLATHIASGQRVAMKYMKPRGGDEGVPSTAIREVAILQGLQHENIVRLLDVSCLRSELVLVFECLACDLHEFMNRRRLAPDVVKDFSLQLTCGLHYCHSRRVMHRDLKPQNILLSFSRVLKIADFGLGRVVTFPLPEYTHEVFTLLYRPPEILLGAKVYGLPADIWSVGCIMAEMASGMPLFDSDCRSQIGTCFKIFQKLGTPDETLWPGVSELPYFREAFPKWKPRGWKNIRNIVAQVGDSGIDLLEQLMQYAPTARISAREALAHSYFSEVIDVSRARLGGA